jgi:aminoglycoside phosphotransferase (APT) family kinase protein
VLPDENRLGKPAIQRMDPDHQFMNSHSISFSDIPASKHWRKIEFLDKGWSADKKYYIESDDGKKLVIRIADISQYENKKAEFQTLGDVTK